MSDEIKNFREAVFKLEEIQIDFEKIKEDTDIKLSELSRVAETQKAIVESINTLLLNIDKKDDPHFKRLEEQFLLLTPRLSAPADGADCVEGGVWWITRKTSSVAPGSMSIISTFGRNSNRI